MGIYFIHRLVLEATCARRDRGETVGDRDNREHRVREGEVGKGREGKA